VNIYVRAVTSYKYFMVVQTECSEHVFSKKRRKKEYSMRNSDIYVRLLVINNFMVVQTECSEHVFPKKSRKKEYSMRLVDIYM